MPRRPPPRDYYEEDEEEVFESERERYHKPRRRERDFDDELRYRRRGPEPPVEDLERLYIRERPPRDFVRENYEPRSRERVPVIPRRSREEVHEFSPDREYVPRREREEAYIPPPGSRRRHCPRTVDEEDLIMEESDRQRGRRRRAERELEKEDLAIRSSHPGASRQYDSEEECLLQERSPNDDRDEVHYRSSASRRRPRLPEVEVEEEIVDEIDEEQDRRSRRHHRERRMADDNHEMPARWKESEPISSGAEDEDLPFHERDRRAQPPLSYSEYEPGLRDPSIKNRDDSPNEAIRVCARFRPKPRHRYPGEDDHIVVPREQRDRDRDGRQGSADSEEIYIHKRRRRPSSREVSPIRAPPVPQDSFVRRRPVENRYEANRLPRAPSPELPSVRTSLDEVDLHHHGKRTGRESEEDIVLEHKDSNGSLSPRSHSTFDFHNPWEEEHAVPRRQLRREPESMRVERPRSRDRHMSPSVSDIEEKIEFHKRHTRDRSSNAADDWSMISAPRNSDPVEMSGALNVVEIAPRDPSEDDDDDDEVEVHPRMGQKVVKDRRDERWTEIAKDLVVKEAIERMGYEYDETRMFYYIFSYLERGDIDELVDLSDEIRHARRRRIREINRERAAMSPPVPLPSRIPPRPGNKRVRERVRIDYT
ncbi:hypothetical protein NUU61_001892 [Penicillium alfredii]|uniref:DUF8035 domain-containing protein n=1 Tax=Penicillium alfredii TaxID=1506179 RepID=A0A9W9FQJ9_9EURO|nr:uncharacterized protein NUU61_001892 [Penicillium alfredii]KAJ5104545.1 hypothetical protein NUU61_001892 [Penicillium alfredii]